MNKLSVLQNNLRALGNLHGKAFRLTNLPTYFWLEPTNNCNLKCVMCPTGMDMLRVDKGFMDFDLYKKIIDEIKGYASAVTLAVAGESLYHPQFFAMSRYAADQGIKPILNTNATMLTPKKAEMLLESGVTSISFAFDGFNKGQYEKARVGAQFEKTLGNILYFLELKKKKGKKLPYCVLSILMLGLEECTPEEQVEFLARFKDLIDEVRVREVSTWGSSFKNSTAFSFRPNPVYYPPCSRLWSTGVISWNGTVLPCIYDSNHELALGNLRDSSFKEIWNGRPMMELRRSMLDGTFLSYSGLCENCIVLGTPPIMGIPSGIRLSLADAITNMVGYRFERLALALANKLRKGRFTSKTVG
ncbi:MAG: Radical SAM protein [Magnetococcales bacterium]|nr:Radical SAM protein [Magnetococcales bacterium]HIJ83387.1 radical SAM protein [Magnetococcales bacterium]